MRRLFWKFFLVIWLSQTTVTLGVGVWFWLERQGDHRHEPPPHQSHPARPEHPAGTPGQSTARPALTPPRDTPDGMHHRPPPRGPRIPWPPLILGFFGSLLFAALLARYFSRPIRELRQTFSAVAGGDLGARAGPAMGKRQDELADLGKAVDRMLDQLQSLMASQRGLLHDVSHELRSPLARLQAAAGLARQRPERSEEFIQRVEKESQRIDHLVDELLLLSRLENGMGDPQLSPVDLPTLLQDMVEDARCEAAGRPLVITVQLPPTCPPVSADPAWLHRAIENVLRNAIKFSPPAGEIMMRLQLDPQGWLALQITDNGQGVPNDALPRLFSPFFRTADGRRLEGHGLGLAITRRIVEDMGGSVGACNRPEGGFAVDIRLPPADSSGRRQAG